MVVLENVSYTYPFQDKPAVQNISLSLQRGEVSLVTGASGCGKSTLVRLINGLCPHFYKGTHDGRIEIDGEDITEKPLQEIAAKVGTVFQDPELQFFALNVDDEIAFSHEWQEKTPLQIQKIVQDAATSLGIDHILNASIHDLSEGQKQKVALASVLSLRPKVVVLDEPSANLDPESTEELALLIGELKAAGMTVLIVDHRLYWLREIADRVMVMEEGRIVCEGKFSLLDDKELCRNYGLRSPDVEDARVSLPDCPREGKIQLKDIYFSYRTGPRIFSGVSFALPQKVVGIIGGNGTGKTTLARILTGLNKMQAGEIRIDGEKQSPRKVLKRSSIVLQNTDHQLHMSSVVQELAISSGIDKLKAQDKQELLDFLAEFDLAHLANRHPQSLSGGEKQRLVIACGMVKNPEILILDEPTSGLDGRNMLRIAGMIRKAAKNGACVMVITHDLELLGAVCDYALRLPLEQEMAQQISE